jgi:4-amino-4-deoxy-L-arabinose transferase-like glycosyltransferase
MMLLLVQLLQRGRWSDALLVGVAWGLAALVKEKMVFFPPLILLLILWRSWERGRKALLSALTLLAMLLTILPWVARGYQVTGGFVPITLRSGRALNQGMDESFTGADDVLVEFFQNQPEEGEEKSPPRERREEEVRESARSEKSLVGKAFSRIAADPVAYLRAFVVKLGAFWYYGQPKVIVGNILVQIPILLLAIAGYIRGWKRFPLAPFLVLTLYFLLVHALTIVRMRYSLPVMPENLLLASFFLVDLSRRRRSAQETPS